MADISGVGVVIMCDGHRIQRLKLTDDRPVRAIVLIRFSPIRSSEYRAHASTILLTFSEARYPAMTTVNWSVGNNSSVEFQVFHIDSNWNDVPGVYIFCYSDARFWYPLYIGQAKSFRDRFSSHERWDEAAKLGATHVHAALVREASRRDELERTLIQLHNPKMNVQLKRA